MKGKSYDTDNMINNPSTLLDQEKTVHQNKRTNFEHFDDNDGQQRAIQNDAGDGNFNVAHAELTIQRPPKPQA